MPSGMYLRRSLRRRWCKRPYRGDFSSYSSRAARASLTPATPKFRTSRASLDAYLRRNLCSGHVSITPASDISHLGLVSLPSSRVGQGGLVGFLDRTLIKAIQRHCAAVRVQAIACATG